MIAGLGGGWGNAAGKSDICFGKEATGPRKVRRRTVYETARKLFKRVLDL